MFFKRERPHTPTFGERLKQLEQMGFHAVEEPGGKTRVTRDGCAAILELQDGAVKIVVRPGVAMGNEIGSLTDGGFQKFFRTPSGVKKPALASDLKTIYNFQEDLKEGLGQVSLYNESLGTTSTYYIYDRVEDRDQGVPKRIWE